MRIFSLLNIATLFIGAFGLLFVVLFLASNRTTQIISPLADAHDEPKATNAPSGLSGVVDTSLVNTTGTYGVVIRNLKTGETYEKNADKKFQTASLYKLWIMATVMSQLEKDEYEESLVLSDSVSELNRIFGISPEYAELTEGTVTYTVHEAIEQMITISHNYAALLLTRKAKLANVRTFLAAHNLNNSSPGEPPTTTASDIDSFFEQLYRGRLAGPKKTEEMIAILQRQKLNEKLPKLLPPKTAIAHKTGGRYFRAEDTGSLREIFREIDKLERTEVTVEKYLRYEERYFWFLWPALFILLLEIIWTNALRVKIP